MKNFDVDDRVIIRNTGDPSSNGKYGTVLKRSYQQIGEPVLESSYNGDKGIVITNACLDFAV